MNEKLIQLNKEMFLITNGNVKLIQGSVDQDILKNIYNLRDSIELVKMEIYNLERKKSSLEVRKNIAKQSKIVRIFAIFAYTFGILLAEPFTRTALLVVFTFLHSVIESFTLMLTGTKKQRKEEEERITQSLTSKRELLNDYQKELKIYKEQFNGKEIPYKDGEEVTIKPIDHSLDDTTVKISNLTRKLNK